MGSLAVAVSRSLRSSGSGVQRVSSSPAITSHLALQKRSISISSSLLGKHNVRKFFLGNKRSTILFRRDRNLGKYPHIPVYTEVKPDGFMYDGVWHHVPEMAPQIIAPDLTDCKLKPYVSYRAADIYQTEFTAQDLFDVVYRDKIKQDFKENKLDETGNPLEPNENEKLTPDEAWIQARKTGSDLFSERIPRLWECLEKSLIDEPSPKIQYTSDDLVHPSEMERLKAAETEPSHPKKVKPVSEVVDEVEPKVAIKGQSG